MEQKRRRGNLGEVGEKDVDCPIYELSIYKIKKKKKKNYLIYLLSPIPLPPHAQKNLRARGGGERSLLVFEARNSMNSSG